MAEIKIDLGAFLLQNKKTYAAALAGIVSLALGYFGVTNEALAWKITEGCILAAIAFDRAGTAKVQAAIDEVIKYINGEPQPPEK